MISYVNDATNHAADDPKRLSLMEEQFNILRGCDGEKVARTSFSMGSKWWE